MSSFQPSIPSFLSARRRSQRVLMQIRVHIQARDLSGCSFNEGTETLAVGPHGALVLLQTRVTSGAEVLLKHDRTGEEQVCRVRYLGGVCEGKVEIGLEFSSPRPEFWRVHFPPVEWTVKSPEARKPNPPALGKEESCPAPEPVAPKA